MKTPRIVGLTIGLALMMAGLSSLAQTNQSTNQVQPLATSRTNAQSANTYRNAAAPPEDLETRDSNGQTALMRAAMNDDVEKVRSLIAAGADVNAKSAETSGWLGGMTALMVAGTAECTKVLIKAGADVNARASDGKTVLIVQLESENTYGSNAAIVKELIDAGADVNAKDKHGLTALMLAANAYGNKELGETADESAAAVWLACVKELIAAKEDVNATNDKGQTALDQALSVNKYRAMRGYAPVHADVAAVIQSAGGRSPFFGQ